MHKFDWKVIALNESEAIEKNISSLEDFEKLHAGKIKKIMQWFNKYKMIQCHTKNALLKHKKILSMEETIELIKNGNKNYSRLVSGAVKPKVPIWLPPK